ncbi:MAG: PHP domain-containing protein [Burkholderiales bacterium]|nr:PHP domain-containing protein [Burkholderiales bacterium]
MHSVDLHAHSTASDGLLDPASLVRKAAANGVDLLALTDHDVTSGFGEARKAALLHGVHLIAGVEVSVTWRNKTIHIVGLDIDPDCAALQAGLKAVRSGRRARAEQMAAELSRVGIDGSFAGAARHAANPDFIGRTHFARYLVDRGLASNPRDVFKRFLGEGKPGFVAHQWATLEDTLSWIRAAGGEAVIAHPGRYNLSEEKLAELFGVFRDLGGAAIEVIAPGHRPEQFVTLARLCRVFGLKASVGSDYHGPGEQRFDLGRLPLLPCGLSPIWGGWEVAAGDGAPH